MYWGVNNLYGWAMSHKLPGNVLVLIWLNKTKVWRKGKSMLHRYKQLHSTF